MNNQFNDQNYSLRFKRQSSCDQGYYVGIDDKLTLRRLFKGFGYAGFLFAIALFVMHVGLQAGF